MAVGKANNRRRWAEFRMDWAVWWVYQVNSDGINIAQVLECQTSQRQCDAGPIFKGWRPVRLSPKVKRRARALAN